MYVNGKMIILETILGIVDGGLKENGGWGESNTIYVVYCKNFCVCHNVTPSTTIKERVFIIFGTLPNKYTFITLSLYIIFCHIK
jgi:hypothetical protein